MLIRKNTKEHSALVQILEKYAQDTNRKKLIKLYIVEAGKQLEDRIPVENTGSFADVYYNLTLDAVLKNIVDQDHQLHKTEDNSDNLYYFESNFTPAETPFELESKLQNEVDSLIKDKKFKVRKSKEIEIPEPQTEEKDNVINLIPEPAPKKNKKKKEVDTQPDYQLKEEIIFTKIDELITEELEGSKKVILDYYNFVYPYLFPFIQNRPLFNRDIDEIISDKNAERPEWIRTVNIYMGDIAGEFILGQNKEHLLYLVEIGAIEIQSWLSRNKNFNNPDFLIITFSSPKSFEKTVELANVSKEILEICELPGFIMTTGTEKLQLTLPLDGTSSFENSRALADLIAILISKKAPSLTSLEEDKKGKVFIDTSLNSTGKIIPVPFTLIENDELLVAAPLSWEELSEELDYKSFTIDTVLSKIKKDSNIPDFLKNKINAKESFQLLDKRYRFLL